MHAAVSKKSNKSSLINNLPGTRSSRRLWHRTCLIQAKGRGAYWRPLGGIMKIYLKIFVVVLAMSGMAVAQAPEQSVQLTPGVARVSLIHGDVSMQRGDSGDWVAVTLNTPIVAGDQL